MLLGSDFSPRTAVMKLMTQRYSQGRGGGKSQCRNRSNMPSPRKAVIPGRTRTTNIRHISSCIASTIRNLDLLMALKLYKEIFQQKVAFEGGVVHLDKSLLSIYFHCILYIGCNLRNQSTFRPGLREYVEFVRVLCKCWCSKKHFQGVNMESWYNIMYSGTALSWTPISSVEKNIIQGKGFSRLSTNVALCTYIKIIFSPEKCFYNNAFRSGSWIWV